jgi:hypothetical protein
VRRVVGEPVQRGAGVLPDIGGAHSGHRSSGEHAVAAGEQLVGGVEPHPAQAGPPLRHQYPREPAVGHVGRVPALHDRQFEGQPRPGLIVERFPQRALQVSGRVDPPAPLPFVRRRRAEHPHHPRFAQRRRARQHTGEGPFGDGAAKPEPRGARVQVEPVLVGQSREHAGHRHLRRQARAGSADDESTAQHQVQRTGRRHRPRWRERADQVDVEVGPAHGDRPQQCDGFGGQHPNRARHGVADHLGRRVEQVRYAFDARCRRVQRQLVEHRGQHGGPTAGAVRRRFEELLVRPLGPALGRHGPDPLDSQRAQGKHPSTVEHGPDPVRGDDDHDRRFGEAVPDSVQPLPGLVVQPLGVVHHDEHRPAARGVEEETDEHLGGERDIGLVGRGLQHRQQTADHTARPHDGRG